MIRAGLHSKCDSHASLPRQPAKKTLCENTRNAHCKERVLLQGNGQPIGSEMLSIQKSLHSLLASELHTYASR